MLKVRLWSWGIGRIIAAIYLVPTTFMLVFFWLQTTCNMILGKHTDQDYTLSTHIIFMFLVLLQVGLLYLAVSPKEYNCMNTVGDFMKYRTLKTCIHKEEFEEPVHFYNHRGNKEGYMHLYISKYWVCLYYDSFGKMSHFPYCIPRNMIELIYLRRGNVRAKNFWESRMIGAGGLVLMIVTKNGKQYSVGYIKESEINQAIETLSEVMHMKIYSANDEKAIRFFAKNYSEVKMQKEFSAKIHGEQEFLDYIYTT